MKTNRPFHPFPLRVSIGLGFLLLIAIFALSGLSIKLLHNERKALEEIEREADSRAMALLSSHVEQVTLAILRETLTRIHPYANHELNAAQWKELISTTTGLRQLFVFDTNRHLVTTTPPDTPNGDITVANLIAQRLTDPPSRTTNPAGNVTSFIESVAGQDRLFAVKLVPSASGEPRWLVAGFDILELTTGIVRPLASPFGSRYEGNMSIQSPQDRWDDAALNWPIGKVLPGWMLAFTPDQAAREKRIGRESKLVLSIAITVIVTMIMTGIGVLRELAQERSITLLRDQFVANVSHELRTPLALIRMYAETLSLGRITDPDKQQQYHTTILRESKRLSRMVDKVLDFSHTRNNTEAPYLIDTDLHTTVADVVADYSRQITDSGTTITLEMDPELPPVRHDADSVRQILINLLDNALKHAKPKRICIGLHKRETEIELSVKDDGQTVSPAERMELINLPSRNRVVSTARGTGLGLHIVSELAKIHRAPLTFESGLDGRGFGVSVHFQPE